VSLGLAAACGVWALPEIVRRVAVARITELSGRQTSIEDVDLNLFTGRFAVKNFRLASRHGPAPKLELERLEGRFFHPALLVGDIRLTELSLVQPTVRLIRLERLRFNVSDLIELLQRPGPPRSGRPWTFTLDALRIVGGTVHFSDRFLDPPGEWELADLSVEGRGVTTRPGAPPGRLEAGARLLGARLGLDATIIRLVPAHLTAEASLANFDLAWLSRYHPDDRPVVPESGTLGMTLAVALEREPEGTRRAVASGEFRLDGLVVATREPSLPRLFVSRLLAKAAEADLLASTLGGAALEAHGSAVASSDPAASLASLSRLAVTLERADMARPALSGLGVELEGLRAALAERAAPFLSVPRLAVSVKEADLAGRAARVGSVELDGATLGVARDHAGRIDLEEALAALRRAQARLVGPEPERAPPSSPMPPPAAAAVAPAQTSDRADARPFEVRLERLGLRSGTVTFVDQAVSPGREWRVEHLGATAADLSTAPGDAPGRLRVEARIVAGPGWAPADLVVDAPLVRLSPPAVSTRVALRGFDLVAALPYLPETLPAIPTQGTLALDLGLSTEHADGALRRATAEGTVGLARFSVVQRGKDVPFLDLPRLDVSVKQVDALARLAHLARVELEGLHLRGVRQGDGSIDLLALRGPGPAGPETDEGSAGRAATSPGRTESPAATDPSVVPAWKFRLDELTLAQGRATFEDQAVAPPVTLGLTDLTARIEAIVWPSTPSSPPATFALSTSMPGGGRTELKGTARIDPLDAQIAISTRDAPIEPYGSYFPFPARFVGFFSGDSVNEVQRDGDVLRLASRGTGWARDFEIRDPGAERPVARMARMEIRGIDFSWPNYALVERVAFTRPELQVERGQDGAVNVRTLFTPREKEQADAAGQSPGEGAADRTTGDKSAPGKSAGDRSTADKSTVDDSTAQKSTADNSTAAEDRPDAPRANLLQTMVLDFKEIALEEGSIRFLDRTTTPPFSQDVSKLSLTIRDASNVLGRARTTMAARAVVGGDAALDLRGELSGIGESFHADLVGELRDYALASANPYSDQLTSWIIRQGKLAAKVHYRIEGDRLTAEHEVNFGGLSVDRSRGSDEAKRRLGVPLGLAVAMLKDSRGNVDFTIPLRGTLSDRRFDWGEAMWAAVRQVLVKVLLSPFNAIGRALRGDEGEGGALAVNPVTFAPGSSVIGPAMEVHLTRVADFLRRSPYIGLSLTPVVTAADLDSLRLQELRTRIGVFQEQRKIPAWPGAVAAYYAEQKIPGEPPATVDAQLAKLLEREPVPAARVRELRDRRLEATRTALTKTEGIQPERLSVVEPAGEAARSGEGRVEFGLTGG
jgi:uncharacterized protein involved in outer membrane biogenesis